MNRRNPLVGVAAIPLLAVLCQDKPVQSAAVPASPAARRARPSDPSWPSVAAWEKLKREVGGRLIKVQSPLVACESAPDSPSCRDVVEKLRNPYYLGDQPALTQVSGWAGAWTSTPSAYAVAAETTADVVAAVNFARENNLRLVVKGGGHSYQGTSSSADSLLIWTRAMHKVVLHDAFVGRGCAGVQAPQPAVTVEAGAMWMDVYDAVTTRSGRYVQGGGCATVGVAGLIQSGGFGSFSKNYGLAAAGLLEAEIVTAEGAVHTVNACSDPDLFWAIKGGGGGSLGVVTRLTLRTRELPTTLGGIGATIRASSDDAFHRLIGRFVRFYHDGLFNPRWGESVEIRPDNTLEVSMVFQGLDAPQAEDVWRPFFGWVAASPKEWVVAYPPVIRSMPAQHWWDAAYRREHAPHSVVEDRRSGAPATHVWWEGDQDQVGAFIYAFDSAWLPASLLEQEQQTRLADALFASSRHWGVSLHFNKGLAGAPAEALAAARDTAMNPAVLRAFALAIIADGGRPAYPGLQGPGPDLALARRKATLVGKAMDELRKIAPEAGAYVSESNFFDPSWQRSFWGENYPRLRAVKAKYDPAGLFIVHHGVGSESWSDDGFTRLK